MTESSIKVKILLIGPVKVGKTTIANFLAGISKSVTEEYHPTAGVRILEFEKEIQIPGKPSWQGGNQRLDIELWDCSGDRKYEAGWNALIQGTRGAIMVFNPEARNQDKELENWHARFVSSANVRETNCLIFAHNSSGSATSTASKLKLKLSKSLSKIPMVNTSIDFDADTIKFEFDNLLSAIYKDITDKRDSEELSILNS